MTLRDKFLTWLRESGITTFTTKDALWWYQQSKSTPNKRADYANLYTLILTPLQHQGAIDRSIKGIWHVTGTIAQDENKPILSVNQEDEFDKYIQAKIKGE